MTEKTRTAVCEPGADPAYDQRTIASIEAIAKYGVGPDTTPAQALETIVNYIAIRRRNSETDRV